MSHDRCFQERAHSERAVGWFTSSQECLAILRDHSPRNEDPGERESLCSHIDFLLAETYRNLGCSAAEINDSTATISDLQIYNDMMKAEFADKNPESDSRLAFSYFDLALGFTMA